MISKMDDLLQWLEADQDLWLGADGQVMVVLAPPKHADAIRSLRTLRGFVETFQVHEGIHSAYLDQFMNSQNGRNHWHFSLKVMTRSDQRIPIEVVWNVNSQTLATQTEAAPNGNDEKDVQLATGFAKALQPLMPGIGIQRQVVLGRGVTGFWFTKNAELESAVVRAVTPEAWAAYRADKMQQAFPDPNPTLKRPRL